MLDLSTILSPGDYVLNLFLASEGGRLQIGDPYPLGKVTVAGRDRVFDVPPIDTALEVTFGDQLKLWGYTLTQSADALDLSVAWGALTGPAVDYKIFVHLFDPVTEIIAAQLDTMPRAYTYPTSLWLKGEVVSDTLALDLTAVPPGEYRVALGWYDPATGVRLIPVTASGETLSDGRLILPATIRISLR
jgi:hypothetical protein